MKVPRNTLRELVKAPNGTKLLCVKGFTHSRMEESALSEVVRLTEGNIYIKDGTDAEWKDDVSIGILSCDAGYACWWQEPNLYFEIAK